MKKKFKETKVGEWLVDKAPEILDVVGDFVPDAGLLGAVGKMIESSQMTPEDKQQARAQLTSLYQAEVEDRKNARLLYTSDGIIQKILAITFTVSYFTLSYIMFQHFINHEINLGEFEIGFISTIFGAMSAKVNTVVDFFFGGSFKKD
jgi:hypothetical protein